MVFCQKDANGIANSEDPGSALFPQTYLLEILGSVRAVGSNKSSLAFGRLWILFLGPAKTYIEIGHEIFFFYDHSLPTICLRRASVSYL